MKDLTAADLDREDVTALILKAKKAAGLTWEGIAEAIGMSPVWTRSACVGMNAMPKRTALRGTKNMRKYGVKPVVHVYKGRASGSGVLLCFLFWWET